MNFGLIEAANPDDFSSPGRLLHPGVLDFSESNLDAFAFPQYRAGLRWDYTAISWKRVYRILDLRSRLLDRSRRSLLRTSTPPICHKSAVRLTIAVLPPILPLLPNLPLNIHPPHPSHPLDPPKQTIERSTYPTPHRTILPHRFSRHFQPFGQFPRTSCTTT